MMKNMKKNLICFAIIFQWDKNIKKMIMMKKLQLINIDSLLKNLCVNLFNIYVVMMVNLIKLNLIILIHFINNRIYCYVKRIYQKMIKYKLY